MPNTRLRLPFVSASILVLALPLLLAPQPALGGNPAALEPGAAASQPLGDYVLIGWNDLGMHCSNKNFGDLCVLPPYNNIWATLIRRGSPSTPPAVVSTGYSVTYGFAANSYSVGKTDFWSYENLIFGVNLPDNVGLTGKGLTGTLDWTTDRFEAPGVPLTPYDDADLLHEQPYQLAQLHAFDALNNQIASTEIVVPVSNEMMCAGCHTPQAGETVEHAILRRHDDEEGTHLQTSRPVLCANCHASNALGLPGQPGLPSLSEAMHKRHAEQTNDCYRCHPGPVTQCLRDVMSQQHGMTCQSCHGSVLNVATTIEQGRRPWLDEPRCGTCHGAAFSESPGTLYRMSHNGHGGLYCSTCHNSPHAILPTREERDNRQTIALQGMSGTLRNCTVCHGTVPSMPGPHGLYVTGLNDTDPRGAGMARVTASPNPLGESTEIAYRVVDATPIRLAVYDVNGRVVRTLTTNAQTPGDHHLVWDGRDQDIRPVAPGVYFCRLETGGQTATARLVKIAR
jgi:hypothetical protein